MAAASPWVDDDSAPLLVDLYELTMAQAYWREGMGEEAVFSLYYRHLPPRRNYVLACGLADALRYLERLSFAPHLGHLSTLGLFSPPFLDWLGALRFAGDVWAMAEGDAGVPRGAAPRGDGADRRRPDRRELRDEPGRLPERAGAVGERLAADERRLRQRVGAT